jgi:uncharacterized membrane protein
MYLAFKLIHLIAVIVFLGNITVGVFWKAWADRTNNAAIIAHTIEGIIKADRIFTIPGVILIVIGGLGAAFAANLPILRTGWILWGIVLFILSGISFGPLSRTQRQLLALAKSGDLPAYHTASNQWNLFGTIALVLPFLAAAIMILKPLLPAFQ